MLKENHIFITLAVLLIFFMAFNISCQENIRSADESITKNNTAIDKTNNDTSSSSSSAGSGISHSSIYKEGKDKSKDKSNDIIITNNTNNNKSNNPNSNNGSNDLSHSNDSINVSDSGSNITDKQRIFFKKGLEAFEKKDYILAEYCFNSIKEDYKILQDHALYYLAKSQLMQNKFDQALKNYKKLIDEFSDSIFIQKAYLEYADLFFLKSEYTNAESSYQVFLNTFPTSDYSAYCRYQLAVCQEKNNKYSSAFENYKKIWLENPESNYANNSLQAISSMAEKNIISQFTPTAEQIYKRGEKFYALYWYESAIAEFKKVVNDTKISPSLEAKTLFKIGMCYFNLRNYNDSINFLLQCYNKYPSSAFADDCLYFIGRATSSQNKDSEAIAYYEKIVEKFPESNYADDALYRIGRLYSSKNNIEKAKNYYKKIIDNYKGGDKISDAFWELGWIQYKNNNFDESFATFKTMAERFSAGYSSSQSSGQLLEKALFWQAKCLLKAQKTEDAVDLLKKIVSFNSYSYYTFASKQELEKLNINITLKQLNNDVNPLNPKITEIIPKAFLFINAKTDNNNKNITSDKADSTTDTSVNTGSDTNFNTNTELKTDTNSGIKFSTNSKSEPKTDTNSGTNSGTNSNTNSYSNASTNTNLNVNSNSTSDKNVIFSHVDKAKELLFLELYTSAAYEIEAAKPQFEKDSYSILQISTLYLLAKDYINSQKIIAKYYSKLKKNLTSPYLDYLYYLTYPYGFKEYIDKYSSEFKLDPLYVLAVIREESRFDPKAGSYAGALGLMQIMPATGKSIANSLNIKNFSNEMLYDPETNIKMGCFYLSRQLQNFNQNKYFACGAYNGGPGAMSKWIASYKSDDIDEFIENITYDETRNYIKKVMASYYFYQLLYK